MVGNLLILFLVIGLAIGVGWLTLRAVRARRRWVKVAGGVPAGLLTLLLAAVAAMSANGIAKTYFAAEAVPALTVAGTAEQIARGEYLVNLSCVNCHGAVDAAGEPTGEAPLSGGWNIAAAEGFGFMGAMVTENLTPGASWPLTATASSSTCCATASARTGTSWVSWTSCPTRS